MTNSSAYFVAVDWGTTSFRGWLLDKAGAVINQMSSRHGIRQTNGKAFAEILGDARTQLGPEAADKPVVMCGMIGSAQGWQDAGYLTGTATIEALAKAACFIEGQTVPVWIVPGVQSTSIDGLNDVMRGEETALAGMLVSGGISDGLFCLPGTHSKWVRVEKGVITSLSSFMTGEMFDIMQTHSILSPFMNQTGPVEQDSKDGFVVGLDLAKTDLGLLHQLFAVRAGILTGKYQPSLAKSMLSGLCIGAEIVRMRQTLGSNSDPIYLNASGVMAGLYHTALQHFGISFQQIDGGAASRQGLFAIASHLL